MESSQVIHKTRGSISNRTGEAFLTFDGGLTRPYGSTVSTASLGGYQEILTENHPGFFNSEGGDQGGPFHSRKTEVESHGSKADVGTSYYGYSGELGIYGLYAQGSSTALEGSPVSASNDSVDRLFALGGTAISRSLPTNPVGGAATFLGELRESVPHLASSLFRERAKEALKAQKAGSSYLGLEFGWKPLVADLRKFALGVKKHDEIVSQLSRDSGRNVRRGYKFPDADDESTDFDNPSQQFVLGTPDGGGLNTYIYAGPGHYLQSRKSTTRTWFSGCFTYYLPDYNEMFGAKRYLAEADKVLGVKITPEVVWNLAPWSWAADWFANTGDVLNNLTQFSQNDFAMRYGYVMQTKTQSILCQGSQQLNTFRGVPEMHYASRKFTATAMTRVPASPFGFGFTASDFSPRQIAISAALGISRFR